jgi:hypothetical protein
MPDNAPLIVGQLNTTSATTRMRTPLASGGPPTTQFSVESQIPAVTGTSVGSVGVLGVGIVAMDAIGNFSTVGVSGQGTGASGSGVTATCAEGFGVIANGQTGVYAQGTDVGVLGFSAAGPGVIASSDRTAGLEARSVTGPGLSATSQRGIGATVSSGSGPGLVAQSGPGAAVYASTVTGIGVRAVAPATGWAGYLQGRVGVEGALTVFGGPLSEAVGPRQRNNFFRRLYSQNSPDSIIEDFGTAQLAAATVVVNLRPDFAALIQPNAYDVFVTAYGPTALYVHDRTAASFRVSRVQNIGGAQGATAAFAYRIVGRPRVPRPRLEPVQAFGEKIMIAPVAPVRKAKKALTAAAAQADLSRRANRALAALRPVRRVRKGSRKLRAPRR